MRKSIVLAMVAGLGLTGCNSVLTPTTTTTIVTNTTTILNDVVAASVAACGFVPAATTIEQILNASNTVLTATEIAGVICKAVTVTPTPAPTPAPSKSVKVGNHTFKVGDAVVPSTIEINGQIVVIHGNFVTGVKHHH
jgi:hypothetical protein